MGVGELVDIYVISLLTYSFHVVSFKYSLRRIQLYECFS